MPSVKKNISIIPAINTYKNDINQQAKMIRVAAYCRVSTLQEQQESSYEAQVSYYTEKITSNPCWKLLEYMLMMAKVLQAQENVWTFNP